MPTALPIIRGSSAALYPFTQTYICFTEISNGENGQTARCPSSHPIVRFELPFDPVSMASKDDLKSAFTSAKGQFSRDRTITLGSTFSNLSFDSDEFSAAERISTKYGVRWVLTQALSQDLSPGTAGDPYPTLVSGAISQRPYTQKKRFKTIVSKTGGGIKYTYAEYAGGVTNFPTDGLMAWELAEPSLSDADVDAKIAHFLANWGDCYGFSFTDEDGVPYSNVYYASPQLSIRRLGPEQSAITTNLIQLN